MFQRQPWSLPPQVQGSCLRLTPVAWAKLLCLRDSGDCEVGGFGLTSAEDLLLVQDILLIQQQVSAVTVAFDDTAVADLLEDLVTARLRQGPGNPRKLLVCQLEVPGGCYGFTYHENMEVGWTEFSLMGGPLSSLAKKRDTLRVSSSREERTSQP